MSKPQTYFTYSSSILSNPNLLAKDIVALELETQSWQLFCKNDEC